MYGLAMMAWRLALGRAYPRLPPHMFMKQPRPRGWHGTASIEYYRILDRIERGEKP